MDKIMQMLILLFGVSIIAPLRSFQEDVFGFKDNINLQKTEEMGYLRAIVELCENISGDRVILIVYSSYKGTQVAEIINHEFHQNLIPTVIWDINENKPSSNETSQLSSMFSNMLFRSVVLLCTFQESFAFIEKIQSTNQYFHDRYWILYDGENRYASLTHLTTLEYQEKVIVVQADTDTECISSVGPILAAEFCNVSYNFIAPVGHDNSTLTIVVGRWSNKITQFNKRNSDRIWTNLRGRKLIVTTVDRGEIQGVSKDGAGRLVGHGMIFDIINMMSRYYNFSYTTIVSPDMFYGSMLDNGSWDGMMKQIINKEAHLTAAVFQVTEERNNAVDLSISVFQEEMNILQRRPTDSGNGNGMFRPFQKEVWIILVLTTLTMGLTTYLITRIHSKVVFENQLDKNPYLSITECMWIIFRLLIAQGIPLFFFVWNSIKIGIQFSSAQLLFTLSDKATPTVASGKLLLLIWGLFVLVVSSMYTANLTAFLTVPSFDIMIKKLEDLTTKKDVIWLVKKSAAFISEIDSTVPTLYTYLKPDIINGRGRGVSTDKEAAQLVLDKGYVYLQKGTTVDKIILDNLKATGSCSYCIAEESFFKTPTSMAFPKGSYYRSMVDRFIERLQVHGISVYLYRRYYPTAEVCQLSDAIHERPIKIADYITVYLVLLGGFIAAIFTLTLEHVYIRGPVWTIRKHNMENTLK